MNATENLKKESQRKFEELSHFTSIYILRRTNNLLQEHLPSKTIYVSSKKDVYVTLPYVGRILPIIAKSRKALH
jgi:hypothetical protein